MCWNPDSNLKSLTVMPNDIIEDSNVRMKTTNKKAKAGTRNMGYNNNTLTTHLGGIPDKPVGNVTAVQVWEATEPIYTNECIEWPTLTKLIHIDDLAKHVKSINNNSALLAAEYKVGIYPVLTYL